MAYKIYGSKCQVCSWIDPKVLQFHHVNGNSPNKVKTQVLYLKIIKHGKPLSDIKLLCANHHILADLKDKTNNRGSL